MKRFLHAMCGTNNKKRTTKELDAPGWAEVRMDSNPNVQPDITASLLDMEAIADASFDAAFTAHSLERLYAFEVGKALDNLARVLTEDGFLIVTCADIQSACALVAEDKLLEPAYESAAGPVAPIDIIYGFRPALASGLSGHACRCGFTSRALAGTLSQAGFESIWTARNAATFTLVALATKRELPEPELRALAAKHFG